MPKLRVALLSLLVLACRQPAAVGPRPGSISGGRDPGLRTFIDSMVEAPEFSNAHWGILIVDLERGDTLYSRNAGKLFMPASNMKILTSATALTQLGPDFRYRTTFGARGAVSNGTLAGDLVGSLHGPTDLSSSPRHLAGYGR